MPPADDIPGLYRLVFGVEPSAQTVETLLRIRTLGLTRDDPLAHQTIIQLRVADQAAEVLGARTEAEQVNHRRINGLADRIEIALRKVEDLGRLRAPSSRREAVSGGVVIDGYGKASPLAAYLRHAFLWRRGPRDVDETIVSARLDLAMLATITIVLVVAAYVIGTGHAP